MSTDAGRLVESEKLKQAVQDRLDAHRVASDPSFKVEKVEFDDGVWQVLVTPRNGEVSTSQSREILAMIEGEILVDQGVNTNITTPGIWQPR